MTTGKRGLRTKNSGHKEQTLEEYLEIRDLLSILCRTPYVDYFIHHLYDYFAELLGLEEVDRFLHYNKYKETEVNTETVSHLFIKFVTKYYPDRAVYLIHHFFKNISDYTVKQNLDRKDGITLLDDNYYKEFEKSLTPIPSFVSTLRYMNNTINIITAPPGGGKSLFIMSEIIYQAVINDKRCIMFVVGDMNEYAVLKRMRNIINGFKEKYSNVYKNINDMIKARISNITYVVESYGNLNVYDIKHQVEDGGFDFIFIDYDDNLVPLSAYESGNIYLATAQPYLVMDKVKHGSVVVFAAQGKPSSWRTNYEISSGFLASSSRKEQIADSILVLRKLSKDKDENRKKSSRSYELFVLKDRHGLNPVGQVVAKLEINQGSLQERIEDEENPPF